MGRRNKSQKRRRRKEAEGRDEEPKFAGVTSTGVVESSAVKNRTAANNSSPASSQQEEPPTAAAGSSEKPNVAGSGKRRRRGKRDKPDGAASTPRGDCVGTPTNGQQRRSRKRRRQQEVVESSAGAVASAAAAAATKKETDGGRQETKPTEKDGEVPRDGETEAAAAPPLDFPFPTEPDDHCESPREAYADIAPLLRKAQEVMVAKGNRQRQQFRIYDPYYCDGSVVQNLKELGFDDVYNEKEDCYEVWSREGKDSFTRTPGFDVVVTNPPYSSDHVERLVRYVTSEEFGTRPWFLLLPTWVHKKDYWLNATSSIRPFYVVPKKRYVYLPPKNFRQPKKSDTHKKSSPFVSMWYAWGGTSAGNEQLIRHFYQQQNLSGCDLARSKSALRDLRRKKR